MHDYTLFKQAFLATSTAKGYNPDFLAGCMKTGEDYYAHWSKVVAPLAASDPTFCKRAFDEVLAWQTGTRLSDKTAEEQGMGQQLLGLLGQLGGGAGKMMGQEGGPGLGGALAGGGGGMMIGMLLSHLLGIPLPIAMLLGTLGGSALGFGLGGTATGHNLLGATTPPDPKATGGGFGNLHEKERGMQTGAGGWHQPASQMTPGQLQAENQRLAQAAGVSQPDVAATPPVDGANSAAAARHDENQQVANNVVNPQGGQPSVPGAGQPATPPVVPTSTPASARPAGPAPGAPAPGGTPGLPPVGTPPVIPPSPALPATSLVPKKP